MPGLAYGTRIMTDTCRLLPLLPVLALGAALGACRPAYSPDDYNTRAVQQLNRVEQGVIVGVRRVTVTADGNTGAATGGVRYGNVDYMPTATIPASQQRVRNVISDPRLGLPN